MTLTISVPIVSILRTLWGTTGIPANAVTNSGAVVTNSGATVTNGA